MAMARYDSSLAYDPTTGRGLPARTALITDPDTDFPLDVLDMNGNPVPRLMSNLKGYIPPFQVVDGPPVIRVAIEYVSYLLIDLSVTGEVRAAALRLTAMEAKNVAQDNNIVAVENRLEGVEAMAGLSPSAPVDGQTADLILQPETLTNAALSAAIGESLTTVTEVRRIVEASNMPLLQSSRATVARLENRENEKQVRVVRLVTGKGNQVPNAYAGMTIGLGAVEGTTAWRIDSTSGPNRLYIAGLDIKPTPVNAVTALVYVENPSVTETVSLSITGPGGTWSRTHNQSGSNMAGKPLVRGWNLIRFSSLAAPTYPVLRDVETIRVTFNTTGPATNYVAYVDLEVREKATVVIVNDWASKPFFDNGYPALLSRGYPVVWAPRVERLGMGTYPDDHISLAEAQAVMGENNNDLSFHSPDGSATSGLTPAQARKNVLDALVGLKMRDLYSDGALWRAAWVQNLAPNASASDDLLVCSATPDDRYHNTSWPPLLRHDIPRNAIHGVGADVTPKVRELKETHGFGVFYTHGVIPTEGSNHSSQAQWDAFVSALDIGVSEGWLEVLSMTQVLERYPLTRHAFDKVAIFDATPPPPPVDPVDTPLLTGNNDVTPLVFGGQTVTHAGTFDGHPAWKIDATSGEVARIDVEYSPEINPPGTPIRVTAWLYVADPVKTPTASILIYSAAGTWQRVTNQSGSNFAGANLLSGWNEVKIEASASNPLYLVGINKISVRFTVSEPAVMYLGPVKIESMPT